MEQLLNQGIFEPKATPEQTAALERLETLLALIEGWVQTVVTDALGDRTTMTNTASGMLIRKTARHVHSTSHPPRNGPTAPATPPRPDQAPTAAAGRARGTRRR